MYTVIRKVAGKIIKQDEIQGLYEGLASNRNLFLYGAVVGPLERIDSWNPGYTGDSLIAMSLADPKKPIILHIDSPGGSVRDGLRLIDIMKTVEAPVWTVGASCYSMGAMILAAGEFGHRYVYPHSHTMLHLPSGTTRGDAKQVEIQSKEMQKVKRTLVELLKEWGASKDERAIIKDMDREYYLSAPETIAYGLADRVVTKDTFTGLDKPED